MIRVGHVVVAGEIGGAERMLAALAAPGSMAGVEHAAFVLSPDDRVPSLLRAAGIPVEGRIAPEGPLSFLRLALGPAVVSWIAGWLRTQRADVAHLHTFASQVAGTRAALLAGVPVLRTEHSTRAFVDPSCVPFTRWSLPRASLSVAVSQHVRAAALARSPGASRRMRFVPNGVDVARFAARPSPAPGPLRLALVGRLEPRKGADLAVEVLARTHRVCLDVIGDGPARPRVERLVRRLGVAHRVRMLGFHADVRPALAGCDAALCTARTEGLGVALLEAMAMQRPVLGFAVGGVPEIANGALSELLVPPGDVAALADRIQAVAEDPRRIVMLGELARNRVVEQFSLDAMIVRYRDAYADVLDGTTLATS